MHADTLSIKHINTCCSLKTISALAVIALEVIVVMRLIPSMVRIIGSIMVFLDSINCCSQKAQLCAIYNFLYTPNHHGKDNRLYNLRFIASAIFLGKRSGVPPLKNYKPYSMNTYHIPN